MSGKALDDVCVVCGDPADEHGYCSDDCFNADWHLDTGEIPPPEPAGEGKDYGFDLPWELAR